jgi:hypothetical protein
LEPLLILALRTPRVSKIPSRYPISYNVRNQPPSKTKYPVNDAQRQALEVLLKSHDQTRQTPPGLSLRIGWDANACSKFSNAQIASARCDALAFLILNTLFRSQHMSRKKTENVDNRQTGAYVNFRFF